MPSLPAYEPHGRIPATGTAVRGAGGRAGAWEPDVFYGKDKPRTLEDLENEYRQEKPAGDLEQRPIRGVESVSATGNTGGVQDGGRSGGGGAWSSGRDRAGEAAGPGGVKPPPVSGPRAPWPQGFSEIVVQRNAASPVRIKSHPDYEAAKSGDVGAASHGSEKIALDPALLAQVREKMGSIEPEWIERYGYGFGQLTQSEARQVLRHYTPDALRDRFLAGGQAGGGRTPERDSPSSGARRQDKLTSPSGPGARGRRPDHLSTRWCRRWPKAGPPMPSEGRKRYFRPDFAIGGGRP